MSKEKQIEELTNELVFTSNYGTYNAVANYLVNKGYRKQSEGEWIFRGDGRYGQTRCYCSLCGKHSGIGGIRSNQLKPFCPNCGAKMKGDDTE